MMYSNLDHVKALEKFPWQKLIESIIGELFERFLRFCS